MKKILSMLLVLSLICTGCVMFASCGGDGSLKAEDLQGDDQKQIEVLADGAEKAIMNFFDVAGAYDILNGMDKGSVQLIVDNDQLADQYGIGKIDETLYFDLTNGKLNALASETKVDVDKETYDGMIYFDGNAIAVKSEDLLGTRDAYKITISDLLENFEDSALEDEIDNEDAEQVKQVLEMVTEAWTKLLSSENNAVYNSLTAYGQSLIKCFKPSVSSDNVNGTDVIAITYTIDNDTIEAFLETCVNELPTDEFEEIFAMFSEIYGEELDLDDMIGMMEDSIDDVIDELSEVVEIDIAVSFAVAKDSGALVAVAVKGTVEPLEGEVEGSADVDVKLMLSSNEISLSAKVEAAFESYGSEMEMAYSVNAKLTKESSDGKVTIKGDLDVVTEQNSGYYDNKNEMDDLVTFSVTYKKDGDLKIKVKVDTGSSYESPVEMNLKGNLKVEDGKVALEIDSVGASGVALTDLGVTVIFDPDATVPSAPSDAIELITMSEDEWMELIEDIEDSLLGDMFFGKPSAPSDRPSSDIMIAVPNGEYTNGNGEYYSFYGDGSYTYYEEDGAMWDSGTYEIDSDGNIVMVNSYGDYMYGEYYGGSVYFGGEEFWLNGR